jgi:UPF0755 protein
VIGLINFRRWIRRAPADARVRRAAGVLVLIVALSAAGIATANRAVDPAGRGRIVVIPAGASSSEIGRVLKSAGVVRRSSHFVLAVRLRRLTRALQGGEYLLSPSMTLLDILDVIAHGQVVLHPVTIPEGFTAAEIVDELALEGLGERARLAEIVERGADLFPHEFLHWMPIRSLEGYLFPDTYRLPRGIPEREVIRALLDRFEQVVVPMWKTEGGGRSLHEVITLASLVEREARLPHEQALIAGVLYNRLRRGMRLEVDATVLYALGRHKSIVTYKDLEINSPYNTYRRTGLPPGPIANPGLAAIRAALAPATTNYLYYVARPDGSHVFSRTYQEHLAAIRRYRSVP